MRFKELLGHSSKRQRPAVARRLACRPLVYESLENRRLLAGVSASVAGSVLTISIDGDTEDAYVSKLPTGNIKVAKDAAGAALVSPANGYPGVKEIRVEDANSTSDAQLVTFQNDVSLPDGLWVDYDIETTTIEGDISDVTEDSSVSIYSDVVNLGADILTAGGVVEIAGVLVAKSDVTIATGENGVLVAGDVELDDIIGPGGLTVDATADGGDGDVTFDDVGVKGPLAHLRVATTGELSWWGRRILTNGDVLLSASILTVDRRFLNIDSQSLANGDGGEIELEFASIDDYLRVLQLNTSGGAGKLAGSATLPLGFERMATNGMSAIFQESTTHTRIVVNESALTPPTSPSTTLFTHNFAGNAGNAAIKPQATTHANVASEKYQVVPSTADGNAVSIIDPLTLPANFALSATVNMNGMSSGSAWSNGLLIFDFINMNNYKYAGAAEGADEFVIGEVVAGSARKLAVLKEAIASNTDIALRIEIRGAAISLLGGGSLKLSHTFGSNLSGKIGVGAMRANTTFDDLLVTSIT